MKKCPFCAEMIQDEAIVCRYCGRDLPAAINKPNPDPEIELEALSKQESTISVKKPKSKGQSTRKSKEQSAQIFPLALLTLLVIVVWVIAANPQSPSSNKPSPTHSQNPTFTPKPTLIPFVMPKGDFTMSWDLYNSQYNSLGGILTIRRQGLKYTEKLVMSDGSSGTYDLTVISEGSEIKLSGHLGNPYSLYPHDYIQIESNGWLGFYDDLGYIFGVPPLP